MSRLFARPKVLLAALAAAALSFIPAAPKKAVADCPLRVSVVALEKGQLSTLNGDFRSCTYRVSVENVSGKVVRGYALRSMTVAGPPSVGAVYPDAERQTLRPGESKVEALAHVLPGAATADGLRVTVDYVNFEDGTTWGSDREHDAFFIRR